MTPRYRVAATQTAERKLAAVPEPFASQIVAAIEALGDDAKPHGCRKLAGMDALYRIRVGKYRIAYEIREETRLIAIVYIDRRDMFYQRLKRFLALFL